MAAPATRHQVHHVLHRPMEWLWIERSLCVLVIGLGLLTWDVTLSLAAGGLVFLSCYAAAYWATRREPQLLKLLLAIALGPTRQGWRLRSSFDPLKQVPERITVRR
jgi:hypothetical protein